MHPEAVCQKCANIAPTSASRTTATPTGCCSATKPATLIDGDDIMAIAGSTCSRRHARRKNARRHRHEQRRAGRRHSSRPAAKWFAPPSATRTSSMRCCANGFNFGGEQSGHLIFRDLQHHWRRPGRRPANPAHHEGAKKAAFRAGDAGRASRSSSPMCAFARRNHSMKLDGCSISWPKPRPR